MQKTNAVAVLLLLGAASVLSAQGKPPMDTAMAGKMQRMEAQMKKDLGLTDDQATKFHATHERFHNQRRDVMQKGRAIHDAIRGQLQPGVAANADSVRKLLDAWYQNRAALLQSERDADKEMATYLTPVQRARVTMMYGHMMMRGRMHGHGEGMGGMDGMDGMDDMDGMGGHMGDPHRGDMHHKGESGAPPPRS